MAHFDHAPAEEEPVDEPAAGRRARQGLALFAVYLALGGDPEVENFQLGDDRGTRTI